MLAAGSSLKAVSTLALRAISCILAAATLPLPIMRSRRAASVASQAVPCTPEGGGGGGQHAAGSMRLAGRRDACAPLPGSHAARPLAALAACRAVQAAGRKLARTFSTAFSIIFTYSSPLARASSSAARGCQGVTARGGGNNCAHHCDGCQH